MITTYKYINLDNLVEWCGEYFCIDLCTKYNMKLYKKINKYILDAM